MRSTLHLRCRLPAGDAALAVHLDNPSDRYIESRAKNSNKIYCFRLR